MTAEIKLTTDQLDIAACTSEVMSATCGGIDVFIGTVRGQTKGRAVQYLEFEAYEKMAVNEIEKILKQVGEKWLVEKLLVHHRTGKLSVGEVVVIIAVSAAHRAAAFEACRYIIDTLKQTVPIWKREFFEDGDMWVSAYP